MKTITAQIGKDHYSTQLRSESGNIVVSDEPATSGGTDAGFSPEELLASALGACTCITVRMYADRKGWPLASIEVKVTFDRKNDINITDLHRDIIFHGELTEEQTNRLLIIANKCPIHEVLSHPIHIDTKLVV